VVGRILRLSGFGDVSYKPRWREYSGHGRVVSENTLTINLVNKIQTIHQKTISLIFFKYKSNGNFCDI
jgi:hypothetical protein